PSRWRTRRRSMRSPPTGSRCGPSAMRFRRCPRAASRTPSSFACFTETAFRRSRRTIVLRSTTMSKRSSASPSGRATNSDRRWCCVMAESAGFPQLAGGSVVTVGTFDGVHRGHRDILRRLHERAERLGLPALVVTFRPHPLEVVHPEDAPLLLTPDGEQLRALTDSGPLLVAVLPFTPGLARLSADEFVDRKSV